VKKLLIGCAAVLIVCALGLTAFLYLLFHRTEGHYFDSNGVRIHYTVEGKGEPVILIHGVGANADLNWRRPGITRSLARDFQVIAFDLRGHGLSGQPTDPNQYGVQMVEDVVRLMDHLKIKKAHVAGYSLGGFLLVKLLALHPDRIQSAAICAAGWKDPEDPSPIPNPYVRPKQAQRTENVAASTSPTSWLDTTIHRVRRWAADKIANQPALKALKASYMQLGVSGTELESNKVPTICLIGSRDGLRAMAEDLRKHMANLEFIELPGANHLTTPFYPEFKRRLQQFFKGHPAH
jgi:pimeloyl-ACP methyl ester carboxylesterase